MLIRVYLQKRFHKMLHYMNISESSYNTLNKPRMAKKMQHLQIIPKCEHTNVQKARTTLNLSHVLPEIFVSL